MPRHGSNGGEPSPAQRSPGEVGSSIWQTWLVLTCRVVVAERRRVLALFPSFPSVQIQMEFSVCTPDTFSRSSRWPCSIASGAANQSTSIPLTRRNPNNLHPPPCAARRSFAAKTLVILPILRRPVAEFPDSVSSRGLPDEPLLLCSFVVQLLHGLRSHQTFKFPSKMLFFRSRLQFPNPHK